MIEIDVRIKKFNERIDGIFRSCDRCQRISEVEGIGPITARAVVSVCSNAVVFKNGREFSAWLGENRCRIVFGGFVFVPLRKINQWRAYSPTIFFFSFFVLYGCGLKFEVFYKGKIQENANSIRIMLFLRGIRKHKYELLTLITDNFYIVET